MRVILTGSIKHNDREDARVPLECRDEGDGRFRWYCQDDNGEWMACEADGEIGKDSPAKVASWVWQWPWNLKLDA